MTKILTDVQKEREKRLALIIKAYNDQFVPGSSITEFCRKLAKKHKCSYSTVYNLIREVKQ